MKASLDGCEAKLRGADCHLKDVERDIIFALHNPFTIQTEYKADLSKWVFSFTNVTQPPIEIGIVIGDFVHNLRSSLDHLVYQLIKSVRGDHDVRSFFPVFADENDYLNDTRVRKCLAHIPPAYIPKIDALQPYAPGRGGHSDPLWLLRELDDIDKHRTVHVGIIAVRERTLVLTSPPLPGVGRTRWTLDRQESTTILVEEGAILSPISGLPVDTDPRDSIRIETTHDIHFRDGSKDIAGRPVLPTLHLIRDYINGTVFPEFYPAFL